MDSLSVSLSLNERANRVLPPAICGGSYSFINNPAAVPNRPSFFSRANGARVWDADGREYIDYLAAFGPNLLGYGDLRIESAASRQRALGDTMSGPAPILVELAETLVDTVTHADWALFAKSGRDSVNAALLIARACTGKRRVLVSSTAYHGAAPWCTPITLGVPPEHRTHRAEYIYNDVSSIESAVAEANGDLAAILVTGYKHDGPVPHELPTREFASRCRQLCDSTGAVLIVDDVRAGLRLARDCTWSLMGIDPDLSCWSKAIANGYPISALLGSERVRHGAKDVFIAGTFWHQAVPMAAALATLQVVRETDYLEHMIQLGGMLRTGLAECATTHGFNIVQSGPVQMPTIVLDNDPDCRFNYAFASELMKRGIYLPLFHNACLCAAMTVGDIERTLEAAEGSFAELHRCRASIKPNPHLLRRMELLRGGR